MKSKHIFYLSIQLTLIYFLSSCTPRVIYLHGINAINENSNRRTIQTIKTGDQIWLTKNLDVDHYRNGDTIPNVQNRKEWRKLKTGAWCYYFNNTENGPVFGRLYNWYAVNDHRGLAPEGWHIPTDAEWDGLADFLGGEKVAGGKMKENETFYWQQPNKGATNESGFTAMPNGLRCDLGSFYSIGSLATFWSASQHSGSTSTAWGRVIKFKVGKIGRTTYYKNEGHGVRLICSGDSCKPASSELIASLIQNYSTNTETVKIGTQIWMNKNLEVDHYRNGDSIPHVQNSKEWKTLTTGAWCYSIFRSQSGFHVSKLYNWYAVNDPRGLAPEGWHIPTDVECTTLISYLGGKNMALDKLKETGIIHWAGIDKSVTNEIGFTAIPYGIRSSHGKFYYPNTHAAYWTESQYSKTHAYSFNIEQYADYIGISEKYNKKIGLSVRCILD